MLIIVPRTLRSITSASASEYETVVFYPYLCGHDGRQIAHYESRNLNGRVMLLLGYTQVVLCLDLMKRSTRCLC